MTENEIGKIIVDCAIKLHRDLGPGLLESVYEVLLAKLLEDQGLEVKRQAPVPICYEGVEVEEAFRADLLVEGKIVVELKSAEQTSKVHHKQVLTYLRLSHKHLGYLLNFGQALMKDGIHRIINGKLPDS